MHPSAFSHSSRPPSLPHLLVSSLLVKQSYLVNWLALMHNKTPAIYMIYMPYNDHISTHRQTTQRRRKGYNLPKRKYIIIMWPNNKRQQTKTLNIFFAYVIQVKYVYKAAVSYKKKKKGSGKQRKLPSPNIRNSLLTSVKFQLRFAALCGSRSR